MTWSLARAGGVSGIGIGIAYVAITGLYVTVGQVPSSVDGTEWLAYFGDRMPAWWGIIGVSVLTDALYVPVAAALVMVLGPARRLAAWTGAALLVLFVVLDLAVTWPTFAALVRLANHIGPASEPAAAATYAAAVLGSTLFAVYAILVPSIGILLLSLGMLGRFSRTAGWIGIATGILGSAAVVGGILIETLGTLAIPASILTAAWFVVVGIRLLRPVESSK